MALREGYFVQIGSDEFKWTHDRIHQAAKELASTEVHNNANLVLAQYMMKGTQLTTYMNRKTIMTLKITLLIFFYPCII